MEFDPTSFVDPETTAALDEKFNPETFQDPEILQQKAQEEKIKELAKISPTRAALQGLLSGLADQALGVAQQATRSPMAQMGLGVAGKDNSQQLQQVGEMKASSDAAYGQAKEAHPLAAMLGYGAGMLGPTAALPSTMAGSLGAQVGKGALVGADLAGSQYGAEGGSMIGGAVAGAAVPLAGAAVLGAKGWITGNASKVPEEVAAGLSKVSPDTMSEGLGASQRTGVHLTPGEVAGNLGQLGDEARLKVSPAGRELAEKTIAGRQQKIKELTEGIPKALVPEGKEKAAAAINKMYKEAGVVNISNCIIVGYFYPTTTLASGNCQDTNRTLL